MVKVVPSPRMEEHFRVPLWASITFFVIERPRPVPLDLEVYIGVNIFSKLSSDIPHPVS